MLADGERLSRLWRYVFAQMLDDYTSVLRHAGISAAAQMWTNEPRSTGDELSAELSERGAGAELFLVGGATGSTTQSKDSCPAQTPTHSGSTPATHSSSMSHLPDTCWR